MATKQSTVDYLLEQLAGAGQVSAKKMFGEYGVFCAGRMVALVCDDQLYVKPTAAARAQAGDCPEAAPYPNAKPHLLITADRWEDRNWLGELIRVVAAETPSSAKKKAAPAAPKKRAQKAA